jgi:hypothetical protein
VILADQAQKTLDRQSKSYVEDALVFARWIVALKAATPDERDAMISRDLDGYRGGEAGQTP